MKRRTLVGVALLVTAVAVVGLSGGRAAPVAMTVPRPTVSDYQFVSGSTTPPTKAQCDSVAPALLHAPGDPVRIQRRPAVCSRQERRGRHHCDRGLLGKRHDGPRSARLQQGLRPPAHVRRGRCDLHARDADLHGLAPERLARDQAAVESKGPGLEDKSLWALEVALDVETAHAMAPGANILLVATTGAETLGVQGFPNMMKAEKYVVDNHMAQVISQSFASAEDAFGSTQSLENLRRRLQGRGREWRHGASARRATTARPTRRSSRSAPGGKLIPYPTVEWPASDPLVTGVGGTYLCTDPLATTNQPRTLDFVLAAGRSAAATPSTRPQCRGRLDVLGWRLQPRLPEARLPEHAARGQHGDRRRCAACPTSPCRRAPARARWSTSRCRRTVTAA